MNTDEIKAIIREGENFHIEFKAEAVSNEGLAIPIISFLNGQGGTILLGVEDDGSIIGLSQAVDSVMNAISQICQTRVTPPILPVLDSYMLDKRPILAISVEKVTSCNTFWAMGTRPVFMSMKKGTETNGSKHCGRTSRSRRIGRT